MQNRTERFRKASRSFSHLQELSDQLSNPSDFGSYLHRKRRNSRLVKLYGKCVCVYVFRKCLGTLNEASTGLGDDFDNAWDMFWGLFGIVGTGQVLTFSLTEVADL